MTDTDVAKVAVIIPAFRVSDHIIDLLGRMGPEVDKIYVVDDCCPDGSGKLVESVVHDERVVCLYNPVNLGVGGAVLAGFRAAQSDGMSIGVKVDGDGQMDPSLISNFVEPILDGRADYTKGNRFYDPRSVSGMPFGRIIGNMVLSFVSKFSTGYWNIFDPTNGYIAIDLRLIDFMSIEKINNRFFFETDMLFRCNLLGAVVVDVPMIAVYEDEVSNLKFGKEAPRFMVGHIRNFFKRVFYKFFLRDFSVASLELVLGVMAVGFGLVFGAINFGGSVPASPGTVMAAALPLFVGIMLLLSFLNYDIQSTPRQPISKFLPALAALRVRQSEQTQ